MIDAEAKSSKDTVELLFVCFYFPTPSFFMRQYGVGVKLM
jgi:hypothetical protein